MKTVEDNEHQCIMECSSGHQFYIDAHTEENLKFSKEKGHLVVICPTCKEGEKDV